MTATSFRPPLGRRPGPVSSTARPRLTLADEHVLVLWQVTTSAEKLLGVAEQGRWPNAELTALAGFARAEVLRQVSDEESLLFPAAPAQTAARLARDHVRLREASELLSRAASGEQPMSPGQLAVVVRDFVTQLERHLRSEEAQLSSGIARQVVPATATLGGHPHEWYLLTDGPVVDLDALSDEEAVAAAVDRLLRMSRSEEVELRYGASLDRVWREISHLSPGAYQFTMLQDGPTRWRMLVTRRQAAA